MESSARVFFERLLATPGVSGYEQKVQDEVRSYAADFTDSITTDLHGNVVLCKNPDAEVRVMLAGHSDQIGFLTLTQLVFSIRRPLVTGILNN